ncbi:serine hydrolase domain-containing protein [Acinetobacter haemolyticus]|nr:serine hydrolase domain-containing protein [Acinetobacter haemolyticus]
MKVLIVVLLVSLVVFFTYFYVERKDWQRVAKYNLYALQLNFDHNKWQCDPQAPVWMKKILVTNTRELESFANQISYITPEGKQYTCVSGGVKEFNDNNQITKNTRFVFASLTKVITSVQLLALVEQGKLQLNHAALPLLGKFDVRDKKLNDIQVIDLMRHQAGFDRFITGEPMFQQKDWVWCPYHLERLNEMEVQYIPGQTVKYSNLGYCLLGQILENKQQKPYRQLTLEYLNEIVPSNHFKFIDTEKYKDEVTYDDFYNYIHNFRVTRNMQAVSAVSGLSGNASELANFYQYIVSKYGEDYIFNQNIYKCRNDNVCDRGVLLEKVYNNGFQIYLSTGTYPGFTGYVVVDEKGGIFVSLSNGYKSNKNRMKVIDKVREYLTEYYH